MVCVNRPLLYTERANGTVVSVWITLFFFGMRFLLFCISECASCLFIADNFLLLCMFSFFTVMYIPFSVLSVLLVCKYDMYCTTATGCQPNCS
jgi:hypothetical protein